MRRLTTYIFVTSLMPACISLAIGAPVSGNLTIVSNRADFTRAATGLTVIPFENIVGSNAFHYYPTPPGVTYSGANFTIDPLAGDGNMYVLGKNYYYANNSVLSSQQQTRGVANILVTLPKPCTAIATDYGIVNTGTMYPFTFLLSTGDSFTRVNTGGPNLEFIGFISDTPIKTIEISVPRLGDAMNIDNFTFGNAVPEPSSLALAGVSVVVGGYWRRRWWMAERNFDAPY
jgi:hypothetical protein